MELREVESLAIKNDYADICVYIKQIESINLAQLYRALTSYLSYLILPESEQYLSTFQQHLQDPHSWLSKARLLTQAEAKKDFTKAQAVGASADQALWEDTAKKINYLIEGWDADIALASQQIVEGIIMLIDDNIPLTEVQGEIIEFAQGRGVSPSGVSAEINIAQRLQHLQHDGWVNSSTILTKMVRTVAVQAELFLNRLIQAGASLDNLDIKQSFLFEANYKVCQFIEAQIQNLKISLATLPQKIAKKIELRLNRISVETILQRYENTTPVVAQIQPSYEDVRIPQIMQEEVDENDEFDEEDFTLEVEAEKTMVQPTREEAPATKSNSTTLSHEQLEELFVANEQLLETVMKQIALHRLQLSCFSRIKACYCKFTLFPVFRKIATHLTNYQISLADSLSDLTSNKKIEELPHEHHHRFKTVTQAIENNLTRVKTYLNTLNVHHKDYSVTDEINHWQIRLHTLIFSSSENELIIIETHLQRIEAMDSPYLRATLIMKLDVAKPKLNDMIIANMQSWSSRFVDKETVMTTLNYLGIRIHPTHISKIAPNIHLPKKKTTKGKGFYSVAADYSMTAWRGMRDWLDKRVVN